MQTRPQRIGASIFVYLSLWTAPAAVFATPFGSAVSLGVDGAPIAVAAVDIDGDGALDLITANQSGSSGPTLSVLLGHGNGSFATEERINVNGSHFILSAMTAADFDGDGYADVALGVDDIRDFPPRATVLVYENTGDGQFRAPHTLPLDGVLSSCMGSGDINGDGRIDLIACHATADGGDGALSILLGQDPSGFAEPIALTVGLSPSAVVVADVDEDGYNDLLVVDAESDALFVLYGTGTASIVSEPEAIPDSGTPRAAALRRLDPVGLPALLIASDESGELVILEQSAPRQFALHDSLWLDASPSGIELVESIEDGALLAALSIAGEDRIAVVDLAGNIVQDEAIPAPSHLIAADLDADAHADLVAVSQTTDRIVVWLAGSDPVPTPTSSPTPEPTLPDDPEPTATTPAPTATEAVATPTPTPTLTCGLGGPCPATPASTPTPEWTSTTTATATATATPSPGFADGEPGDANCDGVIDEFDAYSIFEQLFLQSCSGADLNGDGVVTSADVILFILGEFPVDSELP